MDRKIKLLVLGDAVTETGFARVLHSIMRYLPKDDYEIHWLGVNYFGDPHNYPYKIYPAKLRPDDTYGLHRLPDFVPYKPDLIFILNDAWIVDKYLQVLKVIFKNNKPKIVAYIPADAEDHDSEWYENFDYVDRIVAYNAFGKDVISKASPNLKIDVIPHGVDSTVFYKINKPKEEIKKIVYANDREDFYNSFIVFNGNRNQPRKKVEISLQAFALFSKDKPENVKFYYHGGVIDSHVDILKLSFRYGINDRLIVTDLSKGAKSIEVEKLNYIYNATDIGINTSLGEGWGLVNVEHAITGAPQIVPNHSACKELFANCGILIEPVTREILSNINTTGKLVRAEECAKAMEILYQNKEVFNKLSAASIEKFSKPEYSWKNISGTWDTLFKEVVYGHNVS